MPKDSKQNGGNNTNLTGGNQSVRSITHNSSSSSSNTTEGNASKKFRHQNYNKNIYIGTKNAEKWEKTRTRLSFKNDVEFVSYLLKLAESEEFNRFPERFVPSTYSPSTFLFVPFFHFLMSLLLPTSLNFASHFFFFFCNAFANCVRVCVCIGFRCVGGKVVGNVLPRKLTAISPNFGEYSVFCIRQINVDDRASEIEREKVMVSSEARENNERKFVDVHEMLYRKT